MNFKEWLLWKAKTAGELSDLYHKKGRSFISAVEAGKEEAYKEIAESKFLASLQADSPNQEHPTTNKRKSVAQLAKEYKAYRRAHPGTGKK